MAGDPTPAELREILVATAGILCAVGMALFAATRAAGEYPHNSITHRLLAFVISVVVFTLLGLAAGVITRSQPVAVGAIFGLFVAERLLSVVIGDPAQAA